MKPLARKVTRRSAALGMAVGVASLAGAALAPADAEDTGRWEVLRANTELRFRPLAPAPGFTVVRPDPILRLEPPRPKIVSLPTPTVTKPATPPDPAKRENPLAAILRDSTLRYGDVVVFPDGPRVFRGEAGTRHSMQDFVTVKSAGMEPTARNKLLAMPVGENSAWSSNLAGGGKVARVRDVETTGSIDAGSHKTVTVRTGRGDVRVIRVP